MKIGELAERTGLTPSRIRFYESIGLLKMIERQANGYRRYPPEAVLVLSVRAGEGARVQALDGGSNDYVTKSFGIQEFLVRVRMLLRQGLAGEQPASQVVSGPLRLDFACRLVTLDEAEVSLTRKEYAVQEQQPRHLGRGGLSSSCAISGGGQPAM